MEVADLLDAAHGVFDLEAINRGLNRRVCRAALLRKRLLDLADRGAAARPQCLHDPEFEPGEFGIGHQISYVCMQYYYKCSKCQILSGKNQQERRRRRQPGGSTMDRLAIASGHGRAGTGLEILIDI